MRGILPVVTLSPLEYRYALDAAMPVLAANPGPYIICNSFLFREELRQRLSLTTETERPQIGLWVEPLTRSWETDLHTFQKSLPVGAPLIVVTSRPLARIIPERRNSPFESALGLQPVGIYSLRKALKKAGFALETTYGIHTLTSIGINFLSQPANRFRLFALSDRLLYKSKLHYCMTGPLSSFSTVGLIFAKKVVA